MSFTIEQEKNAVQAAYRFQVHAELHEVQLLDCVASVSESNVPLGGPLRLGLTMETKDLSISQGRTRFSVRITIFGDQASAPEQPERHLFEIACRYALSYALHPDYSPAPEEIEAFREGNAIFHCWPYARELVQSTTARMGLPMPPLPFLRLAPKITPETPSKRAPKSAPKAAEKAGG
jgi:hypothetical protein